MSDKIEFVSDEGDKRSQMTEGVEMFSNGQVVMKEGDSDDRCFALNTGRVALYRGDRKLCEVGVDDAHPEDFFLGAAAVLLADPEQGTKPSQPFTITSIAPKKSFCSRYSGVNLRGAFSIHEQLAEHLFGSLSRELGILEEALDPSLAGRTQQQWSVLAGIKDTVARVHKMRGAIRQIAEEIVALGRRA